MWTRKILCAHLVHPGDVNTHDFVCTPGWFWRCEHASFCVHTWFILAMWTRKPFCAHLVHPDDLNTQTFVCTPGSSWRCEHASFCEHTWFILTIWTRKRLCGSCYAPDKYFHSLVHSFLIDVPVLQKAVKFLSRSCVVQGHTGAERGCSTSLRLSDGSNPCVLRVDNNNSNNNWQEQQSVATIPLQPWYHIVLRVDNNNNNNNHQWLEQQSVTTTPLQPR